MPTLQTLAIFVPVSLAIIVVPGPAVLYVTARSVEQGRTAGLVSVLGIEVGTLVHAALAALGLGAVLASSSIAFEIVRAAGAAYLLLLGARGVLSKGEEASEGQHPVPRASLRRLFWQGVLVDVLNPKTALFFLALLPQFVDVERGAAWLQMLELGLIFVGLAAAADGGYALVAARAGALLRSSVRLRGAGRFVSGALYLSLAAGMAFLG